LDARGVFASGQHASRHYPIIARRQVFEPERAVLPNERPPLPIETRRRGAQTKTHGSLLRGDISNVVEDDFNVSRLFRQQFDIVQVGGPDHDREASYPNRLSPTLDSTGDVRLNSVVPRQYSGKLERTLSPVYIRLFDELAIFTRAHANQPHVAAEVLSACDSSSNAGRRSGSDGEIHLDALPGAKSMIIEETLADLATFEATGRMVLK